MFLLIVYVVNIMIYTIIYIYIKFIFLYLLLHKQEIINKHKNCVVAKHLRKCLCEQTKTASLVGNRTAMGNLFYLFSSVPHRLHQWPIFYNTESSGKNDYCLMLVSISLIRVELFFIGVRNTY